MAYQLLYDGYPDPTPLHSFVEAQEYVYGILKRASIDSERKTGYKCTWHKEFPTNRKWIIYFTIYGDEQHSLQLIKKEE